MSSWIPKDSSIYSKLRKYKNKLLHGSRRHDAARTMSDSPRSMITSMVVTKGLSNKAGENNCFLNSAVQILWHLDVFRKNFNLISHHGCLKNSCIFCALKVIFTQFVFSEEKVLPPDALRKALAVAFENQQKFQIGLMDDAAECFENILTRIHFHLSYGDVEDNCSLPHCIPHQKFAMMLIEQVICNCGETSEPLPFVQLVHYVTAHSIINLSQKDKTKSFGHMLRMAHSGGNLRTQCPNKCGGHARIERTLTNVPDVVSIGLIWDSDEQSTEHVRKFLEAIRTELRLVDLFDSAMDAERASAAREHKLVGMVCYYGKHYSAFLLHSKSNCWKSCDDANVIDIGPKWSDVVEKCSRGRYQPLLLLYQNPNASTIDEKFIPKKTTILTSEDRSATATDARRGGGVAHKDGSSSSDQPPKNCNFSNNNNVHALSGIRFDQGPTVTPSAPPPAAVSQSGTKPSVTRPSERPGGPSTRPSGPSVALPRPPSATPSGVTRPSTTPSGSGYTYTRPSEPPRPVLAGSSHSLPRSSDSAAMHHPSSQLLASNGKTGSYTSIPTSHLNPHLHHQQQQQLRSNTAAHVTENAFHALNSPARSVVPSNGNVAYQHRYDVLPSRPAYLVYPGGPLNHLPYPPGTTVLPVMSSQGPSFSNNFPGHATVSNGGYAVPTQQPRAPQLGYGQVYYSGPSAGPNFQVTPVPCASVTNQLDSGREYGKAGNQSDTVAINEVRLTGDVVRPTTTVPLGPTSEMNLMDWSIIDARTLPSPDSDSASSQYDNLLDILSVDEKTTGCQAATTATSSGNGVPLVARNESLTDSYFVVPDAQYLDDMANGKDLTKEADQLIEQSEAKELSGDMHGALICCNQATNLYAMARKDPSNRTANGDVELMEKRASSRSRRLLQQIEYNRMISKSDAKNKSSSTSGITLQGGMSPTKPSDQDLLLFLEDPTKPSPPNPQYQFLMDNLHQLYNQNCGAPRYHWVSK